MTYPSTSSSNVASGKLYLVSVPLYGHIFGKHLANVLLISLCYLLMCLPAPLHSELSISGIQISYFFVPFAPYCICLPSMEDSSSMNEDVLTGCLWIKEMLEIQRIIKCGCCLTWGKYRIAAYRRFSITICWWKEKRNKWHSLAFHSLGPASSRSAP